MPTGSQAPEASIAATKPGVSGSIVGVGARALVRLPTGYRTVIVLHDVEGLEHEEIASILGCHVGTSKSQLHKARGKLREILAIDGITAGTLQNG